MLLPLLFSNHFWYTLYMSNTANKSDVNNTVRLRLRLPPSKHSFMRRVWGGLHSNINTAAEAVIEKYEHLLDGSKIEHAESVSYVMSFDSDTHARLTNISLFTGRSINSLVNEGLGSILPDDKTKQDT